MQLDRHWRKQVDLSPFAPEPVEPVIPERLIFLPVRAARRLEVLRSLLLARAAQRKVELLASPVDRVDWTVVAELAAVCG